MTSMYDLGYRQAHAVLGIEKFANPVARWLVQKAPGFLHNVRTNVIGQPIRAFNQLRQGTLFSKGGLVREGLSAPSWKSKLLLYGIPAGMAAYTIAGDDPDKFEQVGGLATSTLAAGAAFGPLGMLGASAVMPITTRWGRHLGGGVRKLTTGQPSQAEGPEPVPIHELPHPFEGPRPYPATQYGQMAGLLAGGSGG